MARERIEGETAEVAEVVEERVVRTEKDRPARPRERYTFSGTTGKMTLGVLDPSFHYHWANDYPGRIELFLASEYQFVKPGEVTFMTPGVTPRGSDEGDKVSMIVGRMEDAKPLRAYLMKKPMDWYLEDQRKGQERPDAIEEAIRNGRITADTANSKHFYVPKGSPIRLGSDFTKKV